MVCWISKAKVCFNPRTHTGCDFRRVRAIRLLWSFNPRTHTGCDLRHGLSSGTLMSFNPRTHTGCDGLTDRKKIAEVVFQSTHPHGVRLPHKHTHPRDLNRSTPRTHPGCAMGNSSGGRQQIVSIHAPTRGATTLFAPYLQTRIVSIHAPTRGATAPLNTAAFVRMFQSTHPHGVRRQNIGLVWRAESFNPRTHTGCDGVLPLPHVLALCFNPRTHTGCDLTSLACCT